MPRDTVFDLRRLIDDQTYADPHSVMDDLRQMADLSRADRKAITAYAAQLVDTVRTEARPTLMEQFLAEYGLSTEEGRALMCLAEALLRVPDASTRDALIEDKITSGLWADHWQTSPSALVNASTCALLVTDKFLAAKASGPNAPLRAALKRLGVPVVRAAVGHAMRLMGAQFVLGETIQEARARATKSKAQGYTYSYDMLGEAARTEADAQRYHRAYSDAIGAMAQAATSQDVRDNPGISVKLSALHPRYEEAQSDAVMSSLVPRLHSLTKLAKSAGIGLNIDAEEADRLSLSLDVIEAVLSDPDYAAWDGFGVVVQAYGPRTTHVIEWLYAVAERLDRKIMVRLVKGAYWDTEIKRAQEAGLTAYPVFTAKHHTDISYIANARKLLGLTDRLYPQFATHNAYTVAAILHMAQASGQEPDAYEFQRLHGMGDALHEKVKAANGTRCRIYAPVGAHRDLLAYLVRRLLENGANSSFVNQIADPDVPTQDVVADPFEAVCGPDLPSGHAIYAPERPNSIGWELSHRSTRQAFEAARNAYAKTRWSAAPLVAQTAPHGRAAFVHNPARPEDVVGSVTWATPETVARACSEAKPWAAPAADRATVLNAAADLFEAQSGEFFALLAREAGKTPRDAVAELREAVDFLRYYAARCDETSPLGVFACISPWNFPLAIFTGQIAAALAVGNAVLAKPAQQTPLIAHRAIQMLHAAGVPKTTLHALPGGAEIGAALTSNPAVQGVAFTGSTETAKTIHRTMATHLDPGAPLIAETGGLNAMIVDSTALLEQAVEAVIESAFQSAGQRCSALRCLYVQADIADVFTNMLIGAMDSLTLGDPWAYSTDVGPVIDATARDGIRAYIDAAEAEGRVMHRVHTPAHGTFISPTLIRVSGIAQMTKEVFGPVLHLASYTADQLEGVIDAINQTGYGLTFGLQTRITARASHIAKRIHTGNIYVNRNQIGAVVGSQPFGGEGLSGTGPKAGGPHYLSRFCHRPADMADMVSIKHDNTDRLRAALLAPQTVAAPRSIILPGPTGESNALHLTARGPILCLGPGQQAAQAQAHAVEALGGVAVTAQGNILPNWLDDLPVHGVLWWGDAHTARAFRHILSRRPGPILPLITGFPDTAHVCHERHVCIDTTAAGGNADLLNGVT